MTKGKRKNQDSEEVRAIREQLANTIKRERHAKREQYARQILREHEGEYEAAKSVFFKVNGARRILKNA